jgi:ankyrin repeat protein
VGAKVDLVNKHGYSALIYAVKFKYIEIAGELISAGANLDLVDN